MLRLRRRPAVERSRDVLDGRAGFRMNALWGHVSVLAGGGHICELGLNSVPGVNPLWRPEWTTIDPDRYDEKFKSIYGPPPDGKLLAGATDTELIFANEEGALAQASAGGLPQVAALPGS